MLPEGKESPLDGAIEGGRDAAAAAALTRFPGVCRPNVWPRDPAVLSDLRPAFREAGRILADVAVAVAGACDAMLAAKQRREAAEAAGMETRGGGGGGNDGDGSANEEATTKTKAAPTLRSLIESGDAAKGRLLYYYPPGQRSTSACGGGDDAKERGGGAAAEDATAAPSTSGERREEDHRNEEEREEEDGWCGWHVDSGALTALVRAMFLDPRGNEVEDPGPGSGAGLYVRPRRGWRHRRRSSSTCGGGGGGGGGEVEQEASADGGDDDDYGQRAPAVRVSIPEGCVAVQAGEAAQVFSGGSIVATPHCVRGVAKKSKTSSGEGEEGTSRATFALFMQPRWDAPLEPSCGGKERGRLLHSPESVGVARWR